MDNTLTHHGITGMKWGVRKDGGPQGYVGTYPKGDRKRSSQDKNHKMSKTNRTQQKPGYTKSDMKEAVKKAKRGEISNRELEKRITYLKNQKNLNRQLHPAREKVTSVLSSIGETVAIGGGAVVAYYLVSKAVNKERPSMDDVAKLFKNRYMPK